MFLKSAKEYSAKCPWHENPCILPVPSLQNILWTWQPSQSSNLVVSAQVVALVLARHLQQA